MSTPREKALERQRARNQGPPGPTRIRTMDERHAMVRYAVETKLTLGDTEFPWNIDSSWMGTLEAARAEIERRPYAKLEHSSVRRRIVRITVEVVGEESP